MILRVSVLCQSQLLPSHGGLQSRNHLLDELVKMHLWEHSILASITLRSNGTFSVPQKPDFAKLGFIHIQQDPRAIVTNESFISKLSSAAVDVSI